MAGLFYPDGGFWTFMLVTAALAGGAAWQTGQAIASTWKPAWMLAGYALLLGAAARFLHFALFGERLFALTFLASGSLLLLAIALTGWRIRRAGQMAGQYRWAYDRAGLFGWRRKAQ